MLSDKRYLARFFLVHLCLIIPILLTSILAIGVTTNRMQDIESQAAVQQLNNTISSFDKVYLSYYEDSVLLSGMPELLPYKITDNVKDTSKGIDLLKLKQYFDSSISNIFLEYGTELVYSSVGVSRKQVHLKSILGCREESVLRGLSAIESGEEAFIFLFTSDTSGYMLYSYPVRQKVDEHVSVNFVVSFEEILEMFKLTDETQWYQLQAVDGSVLAIGCDSSGKPHVLSSEEYENRMNNGKQIAYAENVNIHGMITRLYYEKMSFSMDNGLYKMQLFNMLLIAVGTVLSAITSWILSKQRINEIMRLESIAKGESVYSFSMNNAYSRLQNIITTGLGEAKTLEKRVIEHAALLRDKTAYVIFHGLIHDTEEMNLAFQELGFGGCPDCYFVGAVSAEVRLEEPQLPPLLKKCLLAHVIHESQDVLLFLHELQASDENRVQRKKIAENIRMYLHRQGIDNVRIGMSQTYADPLKIDCAQSEAVSVLEHVISGEIRDFCGCWENAVRETLFVLPEPSALQKFTEALHGLEFDEARKWLHHVLHSCSSKECTPENQAYIRYSVLQCLVNYLSQENTVEKAHFLKECMKINLNEEKKFIQTVTNILDRCLIRKDADSFSMMLAFIESNYCRSDLTYEEVAAAGGITKTYVSKIFRTKLGMSYVEYLASVRMDRACTLLRTTNYNINDIAKFVGYENPSSFCRFFKDKYRISATDYRKREQTLREKN